jgi:hypothetical protein
MGLYVIPLTLKQLNDHVAALHRHHKPVQGHRFSIGVMLGAVLVGACSVGRPVAPKTDPYAVAEVTRLVTDGTKNACSILYAASARAAQAMGYERIQTFILPSEPGTSLKASGWTCEGLCAASGKGWQSRPGRRNDQPTEPKLRWVKHLNQRETQNARTD